MAWIRWRETKRGRAAFIQDRDENGRVIPIERLGVVEPHIAELILQEVKARRGGGVPAPVTTHAGEALERFLEHLSLGRAPRTVEHYQQRLAPMFDRWKSVPMRTWSTTLFERYVKDMRKPREITWTTPRGKQARRKVPAWGPRRIQMAVQAAKRFIAWAQTHAVVCPDFVGDFKGPTLHQAEPPHLTQPQLSALLETVKGTRLEVPVALAALAGLRYGELMGARAQDLDWDTEEILVKGTKTHRDRRVPLSPELQEILRRHPSAARLVRMPDHHSNTLRELKRYCRKAEVPEVSWHPLRHTFGTLLAASGSDVPTIGRLMGHRPGSPITLRYLHTDPERMRAAVGRLLQASG